MEASSNPVRKAFFRLRDFLSAVKKALGKIGSDNISILASGMVYSTLIAIVPCVTFLSAFLSGLGGTENFIQVVGDWLKATFGESEGMFVLEKLTLYSSNAMSLGIFGLAFFVLSASLLAVQIDGIINNIFRSHHPGGGMKRYGKIIIFIIVMTVFVAFSLSLSEAVRNDVYARIGAEMSDGKFSFIMKKGGQNALVLLIFFFLLYFVPNVKVNISSALAGSVFGTVVMTVFYQIFTRLIISTVKFSVIYGSLAAVLLVLIYFYVVWYIIILTAEATFIFQFRPGNDVSDSTVLTPEREIEEGMSILIETARSFEKGEGGITVIKASSRSGVSYYRTDAYFSVLEEHGFVRELSSSSYILSRPADKIAVADVVKAFFTNSGGGEQGYLSSFCVSGLKALDGLNLSNILKDQL